MIVKDVMNKNIKSLKSDDTVSNFVSFSEKNHMPCALVIDNKKLKGMVSIKKLTAKGMTDPSKLKLKRLLKGMPHALNQDDEISEASKLLLESNLRELPVIEKGKVVGILTMTDVIDEVSRTALFRQTRANSVMTDITSIRQDDDIGKARQLMRENNISRIPIVDAKGNLSGIVTSFDMLKMMKTKEKMHMYSMAAEMEQIMKIPVSTIMDKKLFTATEKDSVNDIFNKMKRNKRGSIIVVKNKKPIGMIILKDLLELYLGNLEPRGMYYQIIGVKDETNFIVNTVERMVGDTIKRLTTVYRPTYLFIQVKKHETGLKSRVKYSVRIRFATERGIFMTKAWDWDLLSASKEALNKLEKICFKQRKISRDNIKHNLTKMKDKFRRGR